MPPFPSVHRTAIRMGIIGNLPGKTPEATMASALYTDIKKWKDGKAGSVLCRWVHVPAIPPAPASLRKVGPKFQIPITFLVGQVRAYGEAVFKFCPREGGCSSADVPSMTVRE